MLHSRSAAKTIRVMEVVRDFKRVEIMGQGRPQRPHPHLPQEGRLLPVLKQISAAAARRLFGVFGEALFAARMAPGRVPIAPPMLLVGQIHPVPPMIFPVRHLLPSQAPRQRLPLLQHPRAAVCRALQVAQVPREALPAPQVPRITFSVQEEVRPVVARTPGPLPFHHSVHAPDSAMKFVQGPSPMQCSLRCRPHKVSALPMNVSPLEEAT